LTFLAQYFDKKIKIHFNKKNFLLQNIVLTFQNISKQASIEQNCPKINIFNAHRKKILDDKCIFMAISFYLFIAILCAKISSVYYKPLNCKTFQNGDCLHEQQSAK